MGVPNSPRWQPRENLRLAGAGVELAATISGACLVGYWIDRHYGTSPKGLLICAIIGVVGGLYNLIRQAVRETVGSSKGDKEHARGDGRDGDES